MSPDRAPSRGRAIAQVIAAAVLFGTTGTARARGPVGIDPVVAGLFRLAIGGPLLVALRIRTLRAPMDIDAERREAARSRRATGTRSALRSLPPPGVVIGALCVAAYQLGFFEGLARTGVSVGTVVAIGSGPVLAGLLGVAFFGERPEARWLVATALAIAGAGLISVTGASGAVNVTGLALVLLAGLGYAGFTMLTRAMVLRGIDGALLLGVVFSAAALMIVPFCHGRAFAWVAEPRGLLVVLWLGVGPTAAAYTLFASGLRTLSGPTTTTFVLAEPVTALVLGRFVLEERLRAAQWFGAALVFAGLVVLALHPSSDTTEPDHLTDDVTGR